MNKLKAEKTPMKLLTELYRCHELDGFGQDLQFETDTVFYYFWRTLLSWILCFQEQTF